MRSLSILRLALAPLAILSGNLGAEGAEDPAKLDLSVGYVFLWNQNGEPKTLPLGLAAGVGFNPSPSLGLVADAGISYNEGADTVNEAAFLGGLRYTFRRSSVSPYIEVLGGGARRSATASATTVTAWDGAVLVGTGILVRLRPGSYLRASVDFRDVLGDGASARRFRLLVGATLGLGRTGPVRTMADAPPRAASPGPTVPKAVAPPTPAAPPASTPDREPATPGEPSPSSNIVQFPTQPPVAPARTPAAPPPAAPAAPAGRSLPEGFVQGTQLLRSGRYADASTAFQASLRAHAVGAFTVPVGLFCEEANVAQLVKSAGDSEPLFVVALLRGGRTCHAVYWNVFASQGEAQRAIASIPGAFRARGQAPVAVSRLLR
jgi:hypothetical protein